MSSKTDNVRSGYPPGVPGQYPPGIPGQYPPGVPGQYPPGIPGQYPPGVPGQYPPGIPGQYPPGVHGQYPPGIAGQYPPDVPGKYPPGIPSQYPQGVPGQYPPVIPSQYPPGVPDQYPPSIPGQYPPGVPGRYPPAMYPSGYNPWMSVCPTTQQWNVPSGPEVTPFSSSSRGDEYTMNSMRRVYGNDDSSIEIERVKVQCRQSAPLLPFTGMPLLPNMGNHTNALVPVVGPQLPSDIRPPPRKHRKNKLNNELIRATPLANAYPPQYYPPYMPFMPYPYPYPNFNYMWPPQTHVWPPEMSPWSNNNYDNNNDENQHKEQIRSIHSSPEAKRLETGTIANSTRTSISPDLGRSLSPTASSIVSQVTDSQTTDIGPSDSVSVGGYCTARKEHSTISNKGNAPDWMIDIQTHLANLDDSSEVGDRLSFTTAPSNIPSPPSRRNKIKNNSTGIRVNEDKDENSIISEKSGSNLNDAFKKLEKSVDIFKSHVSLDKSRNETVAIGQETDSVLNVPGSEMGRNTDNKSENCAGKSSITPFHSIRNSSDTIVADTDSTDIFISMDSATTEEEPRGKRIAPLPPCFNASPGEGDKWVLQGKGEAPDVGIQQSGITWLADVSVWRARLVVSLDRGQGLDQQDWSTFHLLIQHPLPLRLKLSLLHAPRICAANVDIGAVSVRTALLQLARHAQTLLQKEDARPSGWKSITAHNSQPWLPVKGGVEILRLLGFRERDDGSLRYSRRLALDSSHLARLTLDLLIFADELRLYLTGAHAQPTNISDLFCPISFSTSVTPEPLGLRMNNEDGRSVASSADFLSAETTPVLDRKWKNVSNDERASSSQFAKVDYNKQLLDHYSSSEEEVTLHEDGVCKETVKIQEQDRNKCLTKEDETGTNQRISISSSSALNSDRRSLSTDITSLPDLQSMSSLPPSRMSDITKSGKHSDFSNMSSPVQSPEPPPESNDIEKPVDGKKDDHIYEEIGDIRAQVQKLRSCVSVPIFPPPLPPKTRSQSNNPDEDNSVHYSKSDWSTTSSIGGSTGRRRKKRRAPLPPSFLYEDQIREMDRLREIPLEAQEIGHNKEFAFTESLHRLNKKENPFYEEIGDSRPKLETPNTSKNNKEISNPFSETKSKPAGYVGPNPFYEDVSLLNSEISKEVSTSGSISDDNTISVSNSLTDIQFDQSDGKTPPIAAARPKRRAPKPPNNEIIITSTDSQDDHNTSLSINETSLCKAEQPVSIILSPKVFPEIEEDVSLKEVNVKSTKEETYPKIVNATESPKNGGQEELPNSQDIVSSVNQSEFEIDENSENHNELNNNNTTITIADEMVNTSENPMTSIHVKVIECQSSVNNSDDDHTQATQTVAKLRESKRDNENKIDHLEDIDNTELKSSLCLDGQSSSSCNAVSSITTESINIEVVAITSETDLESSTSNTSVMIQEDEVPVKINHTVTSDYCIPLENRVETEIISDEVEKSCPVIDRELSNELGNVETISIIVSSEKEQFDLGTSKAKLSEKNNDSTQSSISDCSLQASLKLRPNITDEILYIDNNDVNQYKTESVESKQFEDINKEERFPINFLQKSMPYIDDGNVSKDFGPPLLPPSPPPVDTPTFNSPPDTPHSSPPPTPPLIEFQQTHYSDESDIKGNSIFQLHEKSEDNENYNEGQSDFKAPVIFGTSCDISTKEKRVSSAYYEIPETPESPPPLPTKPNNLLSTSLLQTTPEIPPKSNMIQMQLTPELPPKSPRLTSHKIMSPLQLMEDDRYEIPDVTKGNAMAPQTQFQAADDYDGLGSSSTYSYQQQDSLTEDSSNPLKPPRRRRRSSSLSPPRPPKTFTSQFPGLSSSPRPSPSFSRATTLPHMTPPSQTSRHLPSSTPSTPQALPRQKLVKNPSDKARKSWPFLFCECLDANYDSNNYNKTNSNKTAVIPK